MVRIQYWLCSIPFLLCCFNGVLAQSIRPIGVAEDSVITNRNSTIHIQELKLFIEKCDSALNDFGSHLVLIAEMADSAATDSAGHLIPFDRVIRVQSPEEWPDYTTTSLLICKDNHGKIIATQEVPVSESGDWHNTYKHYFDENGKTIAFKRYSSFFLGCPSSLSKETSLYIFGKNQSLIRKEYNLTDSKNNAINYKECGFMYRYDYTIFGNVIQFISEKHINELVK